MTHVDLIEKLLRYDCVLWLFSRGMLTVFVGGRYNPQERRVPTGAAPR